MSKNQDPCIGCSLALDEASAALDASFDDNGVARVSEQDADEKREAYFAARRALIASEATTFPGLISKIRFLFERTKQADIEEDIQRLAHALVFDAHRVWEASKND